MKNEQMFKDPLYLRVPDRVTRSAGKIVKVPTKITPAYEHSPFYIGTKLWNDLSLQIQESHDVFAFKKEIDRMNRSYVKL